MNVRKRPPKQQGARSRTGGQNSSPVEQNLLDLMKLKVQAPLHLMNINGLGLDSIDTTPEGGLRIGALVRNTDLAAHMLIRRDYAVLARALLAGRPASYEIRRPPAEICCSARDAPISMIPTNRVIKEYPVADARRWTALAVSMP